TYTWTTGSATNVISNSVGVSVNPTSNQTYSVSATNAFGCVANSAITVTVDQTPTITAVSSNTTGGICPGATVALFGGGATSYTWSGPMTISNGVSFAPTSTGTYVVSGANACGTNTAAITVSIHPLPTIGAVAATGSICSGNTTTINVTGNSVTNTITSTIAGPAVTNGQGFTPAVTNTYTAKGTSALGCTATAVTSVQVVQTPNLAPTSSTMILCIGNSATLTATGATGGYTWTSGTSTLGTNSTLVVTPNTTTTYSVTKNSSTCFDTKPITIQVNSLTPVFASASPTLVCASNTVSLGAFGGVSYQWYASSAPTTSFSSSSNPVVMPAVNTTYTVAASDGTCINTAVVSVQTNTNPIISVVSTATTICLGESATLTASGANNYTWTSNPVTSTTNGQVLTPSFPAAGAYAFFVTGDNSVGCTTTVQKVVIVNAAPTLSVWATKTLVCSNGATTLNVSGANSYQWDAGANNATTNTTVVNPASTMVYNVTGTLTSTGCSTSTTVLVSIYTPTISIMSPTNTCLGGAMTLTGSVNNPASGAITSYTWSGPGIPNTQGQSVVVNPTAFTIYTLTAKSNTLANNGNLTCIESKTTSVGIFYNPTVTVAQARPFVCKGEPVNLIASGANTFTWNGGAYSGATITVSHNNVGTVSYSVVGTDANGCKNDTIFYLKINGCQGIEEFDGNTDMVRIYPNPNSGQFNIVSNRDVKVQLINELGQVIRHFELQSSNNFQVQVSDLAKGIYFIVDEKNKSLTGQKIIVQ
ncbi:MAG: T9SS type A sorting domain-containing protein, partial [Bacteroidia bacterium]|nr:T9SS type A sorting domain-containing protein [Bacteroidia bacterium]